MPYASDKLYNGYLRRKMALIATDVKVREILPHLICLTISDREEIEAKREVSGNYAAMQLLLYNLRRRENWPEQFIAALEECEHVTIAREIREEYNSIQGQRNPKPPSPSATLIKAHVHPEPAINPTLPIAESAQTQPAPSEAAALNPPPPQAPVEPQSPLASAPPLASEAAPPSEPAPHSPQVSPDVSPQSTPPPPSRDPPQAQARPPPPSPPAAEGRRASSPQQPEENSESSLEEVPGVSGHIPPDTIPLVTSELSSHLTSLDTALFQPETASTPNPRPVQKSPISEDTSSQNAPPAHAEPTVAVVVTELPPLPPLPLVPPEDGAADSVLNQTPEKQPVQDTSPPTVTRAPAMQFPEESVGLTAIQVNINRPPIEPSYQRAQTQLPAEVTHAVDSVDGPNATSSGLDDELFSKPAVLLSIQPNNTNPQTVLLPRDSVEIFSGNSRPLEVSTPAYSGNSDHLEISEAVYSGNSDRLEISGASAPVAAPLENGVLHEEPQSRVKPEENQTQSCLSSLGDPEVLVHVGHVSGEPSIQNQDANFGNESENPLDQNHSIQVKPAAPVSVPAVSPGWSAAVDQSESGVGDDSQSYEEPQAFIHNGQATITRDSSFSQAACPAPPPSIMIQPCPSLPSDGESSHPPEPVGEEPLLQKVHLQPVKEDEAQTLSNVKKYILTAAGVGVCAMIVAWRMKN